MWIYESDECWFASYNWRWWKIGFDINETVYRLGLRNIENRTRLINGALTISSIKGEGTTINIECNAG